MKKANSSCTNGFSNFQVVACLLLACILIGFYTWQDADHSSFSEQVDTVKTVTSNLHLDTSEPVSPDIRGTKPKKDRPANFRLFTRADIDNLRESSTSSDRFTDTSLESDTLSSAEAPRDKAFPKKKSRQEKNRNDSIRSDSPLFTQQELRELERSSRRARLSAPGGPPVPQREVTNEEREPEQATEEESEQEEEEEPARSLFGGQERGYTLLNLMHPRARESSERHIDLLLESRVARLLLGVLVDGTFGWDPNYFASVIRRLGSGDQRLTLVIYLTNGPTMRRFDVTPITAGFARVDPDDFRDQIRFDQSTRERFAEYARRVRPLLLLNRSLHPANRNVVIPMLEDNLQSDSYQAARTLARSILGDVATFVRNPCPGCWDGNDTESGGDPIEVHSVSSLELLSNGDYYSLDGVGFRFPGEAPFNESELDITAVVNLIDFSRARGLRGFALWRWDRQGLTSGAGLHPNERVYALPDPRFQAEEIALLRHNLIESVPESVESSPEPDQ